MPSATCQLRVLNLRPPDEASRAAARQVGGHIVRNSDRKTDGGDSADGEYGFQKAINGPHHFAHSDFGNQVLPPALQPHPPPAAAAAAAAVAAAVAAAAAAARARAAAAVAPSVAPSAAG